MLTLLTQELVVTCTLVLARVGGLIAAAPLWSSLQIPLNARALLVVMLTALVAPLQWGRLAALPGSPLEYGLQLAGESLLGISLGLGVMISLGGIQIAGQIAGQLSGMSLADVFNPTFDSDVPLFSHLLSLLLTTIFLLIGGHQALLGGLLHTFESLPVGSTLAADALGTSSIGPLLVTILSESMVMGIRVAAPVMAALLLTTVLLGLIGRTLPQLNIMSLGFGLNCLITLGALILSFGTISTLFEESLPETIQRTVEALESN
ncbi:MAG: flagellar biosynthetic protein FliR [Pirellulales bacterium]|nr:flagellar biosynthetic protein FliR [Pirellulales bacterium]